MTVMIVKIFFRRCNTAKIWFFIGLYGNFFVTHLLENGIDLRYIQTLLGHSSPQATEIYTHVWTKGLRDVVSPIEKLKIEF